MKYFLGLILFFCCLQGQAKIIYINAASTSSTENGATWSTAYKTVKAGILQALDNDQVWIASGVYTIRHNNQTNVNERIDLNYSIKIYGGFAGNETSIFQRKSLSSVISGKAFTTGDTTLSVNLFHLNKGLTVLFDRITFSYINSAGTDNDKGGAVLIDTLCKVNFFKCQFSENNAIYRVSCVNSKGGTLVNIDSCIFKNNIRAYALLHGYDNAKFAITNTEITGNGYGDYGVYFYINGFTDFDKEYPNDTLVYADNINFHDNTALNFIQRAKGSVVCKNSKLLMGTGNAVYTGGNSKNTTTIDNCFLTGAPVNFIVYNYKNQLSMRNCIFDGEMKKYNVGVLNTNSSFNLQNTTFKNFNYYLISASPEDSTNELIFDKVTFENNSHSLFYSAYKTTTILNSKFLNNNFLEGINPLFSCNSKKLILKNTTFTGNAVSNNIPLIDLYQVDSILVDSCHFEKNQTKNWPIFNINGKEYMQVSRSTFLQNFSEYNYMPTGMIYSVYKATLRSVGNLYKGNNSIGSGGGTGVADVSGNAIFMNDVFDSNSADSSAAIANAGNLYIANCDFINYVKPAIKNKSGYESVGSGNVANSIFTSNTSIDYLNENGLHLNFVNCFSSNRLPGSGNIISTTPPLNSNYSPLISTLIDGGTPLPDSVILSNIDFSGNPRIFNKIDIGAVEKNDLTPVDNAKDLSVLVAVYPNPSSGWIHIAPWQTGDLVEITNVLGHTLIQKTEADLWIGDLKEGLYLLRHQEKVYQFIKK